MARSTRADQKRVLKIIQEHSTTGGGLTSQEIRVLYKQRFGLDLENRALQDTLTYWQRVRLVYLLPEKRASTMFVETYKGDMKFSSTVYAARSGKLRDLFQGANVAASKPRFRAAVLHESMLERGLTTDVLAESVPQSVEIIVYPYDNTDLEHVAKLMPKGCVRHGVPAITQSMIDNLIRKYGEQAVWPIRKSTDAYLTTQQTQSAQRGR